METEITGRIVCLVPAWNEEGSIGATIEALLNQTIPFSDIVVIPNGCTDDTALVAREYPVKVMEFPERLEHLKTEALNRAWIAYCQDAELVVTVDADTYLEPRAVEKWLTEFTDNFLIAGSQAKFTMDKDKKLLTRLQKAEYALGIDRSLRRKKTTILAGASSCYRNRYLKRVMELDGREGPWSYDSAVEDFELTYRLRAMHLRCIVSPTIRAITDTMPNLKALRGQRMKWQVGTVEDLLRFGFNKYTRESWAQQIIGLFLALVTVAWMGLLAYAIYKGVTIYSFFSWWTLIPVISAAVNLKNANRIPGRDWIDMVIAGTLVVGEVYGMIRLVWMVHAWSEVIWGKLTRTRKDHWALQGQAEGII